MSNTCDRMENSRKFRPDTKLRLMDQVDRPCAITTTPTVANKPIAIGSYLHVFVDETLEPVQYQKTHSPSGRHVPKGGLRKRATRFLENRVNIRVVKVLSCGSNYRKAYVKQRRSQGKYERTRGEYGKIGF